MVRAAREADLELDDNLLVGVEDGERRKKERQLKQKKQQLQSLLSQPLFPSVFSGRYPTQTGKLVLPKTFTSGSAVSDCLKGKKKRKK
jgi:hypothetical protein